MTGFAFSDSGLAAQVVAQDDVVGISESQQFAIDMCIQRFSIYARIAHIPQEVRMQFVQLIIDKVGFEDDKLKATIIVASALSPFGRPPICNARPLLCWLLANRNTVASQVSVVAPASTVQCPLR